MDLLASLAERTSVNELLDVSNAMLLLKENGKTARALVVCSAPSRGVRRSCARL